VLAGAAGARVIGAALAPPKANAADGGNVVLGQANEATSIRIDATDGGADAALSLRNANGPSLAPQPLAEGWTAHWASARSPIPRSARTSGSTTAAAPSPRRT
jgi:hypothetical protein